MDDSWIVNCNELGIWYTIIEKLHLWIVYHSLAKCAKCLFIKSFEFIINPLKTFLNLFIYIITLPLSTYIYYYKKILLKILLRNNFTNMEIV